MLWQEFQNIGSGAGQVEAGGQALRAIRFPGNGDHLLGKRQDGRPVVLVKVSDERRLRGVRLRNIAIHGTVRYGATSEQNRRDGNCVIIGCQSSERALQEYFLEVTSRMLSLLSETVTAEEAEQSVERLIELFLRLEQPARGSLQGLWAELFVIQNGYNPGLLLEAWHDNAGARYDFEHGGQILEVKSAASGDRIHHFSGEQLEGAPGVGLLASIFVERQGSGLSIRQLWNQIMVVAQGNIELERKVERTCLDVLGGDWLEFCDVGFDERLAKDSMKLYRFETIPRIEAAAISPEISDVRFCVSLEGHESVSRNELGREGLFGAV